MRLLAVVIAALALGGCASNEKDVSVEPHLYIASFYPLAWATEQVAGHSTRPEVINLTPPGVEPHDIELSPSDIKAVDDAELVIYLGGGFQPALEDAIGSRAGRSLDLLTGEDPHIWLDPIRFAQAVERIARAAGSAGSAHGVIRDLKRLDAEYRRGLAACDRRTIVTTHAAFGQLARRYRLTQLSLAGRAPEAEPSPRQLEGLINDVRSSGATTVFTEPLVSGEIAQTVAREAGVSVSTLDPIEGLNKERLEAGEDYVSVMRSNLAALRKALGCR